MVRFGSFVIDTRTGTLTRDGVPVALSPHLVDILRYIVEKHGHIVTKDELLERFWPGTHVTENTLTRAIADIRKSLGDSADRPLVIQTLARRGYRFVGERGTPATDPLRDWVSGKLALESLDAARLDAAATAMHAVAAAMPDYAPAHAGVANTWIVRYEATRIGHDPDRAALEHALRAAQQACTQDHTLGEAWAALAHALLLAGRRPEAQAAARRAIALEPGNWRHHYRLALSTWGEERLRASDRALALLPSCAAAHLLSAMVFVARGAWQHAERVAEAGAILQDHQPPDTPLPAAGLHWMRGLIHAAGGRVELAADAFSREGSQPHATLYSREFAYHARVALGFLRLHSGDFQAAAAQFDSVEGLAPGGARVMLGHLLCRGGDASAVVMLAQELERSGRAGDATLLCASQLGWSGEPARGVDALLSLISRTPAEPTAWSVAADPFYAPLRVAPAFVRLLDAVAARAA